jgi:hypothetical protein
MPLDRRPGKRHDETAEVVRHYGRALDRILDFLGYTIHDVVNDPVKREHVRRAYKISRRIDRDLASESWRTEVSAGLAGRIRERMIGPEPGGDGI